MHIRHVETFNSDKTSYFFYSATADSPSPSVVYRGGPNASALLGGTPEEQALVEQWTHFTDTEIQVFIVLLYYMFVHKLPYSKPVRA